MEVGEDPECLQIDMTENIRARTKVQTVIHTRGVCRRANRATIISIISRHAYAPHFVKEALRGYLQLEHSHPFPEIQRPGVRIQVPCLATASALMLNPTHKHTSGNGVFCSRVAGKRTSCIHVFQQETTVGYLRTGGDEGESKARRLPAETTMKTTVTRGRS